MKAFSKRLEVAAKRIPEDQIVKACYAIKSRAKAIYEAEGGLIERD